MQKFYLSAGHITVVELSDALPQCIAEYFSRNQQHLEACMPELPVGFHTRTFWQDQLFDYQTLRSTGRALRFALLDGEAVVGAINYDQIIRGPFQACYLGYSIDSGYQGKGFMKEALSKTIDHVVDELGLNRIMANYEPSNHRSAKLLKSLGFEREGYARKYLKLNGVWKDHVLTSYIQD